jgi:transcriptional regulator with XRE-family HTH domain
MNTERSGIGGRIREVRKGLKMGQADLGRELGVTASSVSSYESGEYNASMESLVKIAEMGAVTLDWLITGKGVSRGEPHTNHTVKEVVPSYSNNFDEETVATVMALLDQLEDFFGEKLPPQKKAKIFTHIYADKIAGKPIRLTDFGDLLKAQG